MNTASMSSRRVVMVAGLVVLAAAWLPGPAGAAADEAPASTGVDTTPAAGSGLPAGTGPAIGSVEFVDEFTVGQDPLQDPAAWLSGSTGESTSPICDQSHTRVRS